MSEHSDFSEPRRNRRRREPSGLRVVDGGAPEGRELPWSEDAEKNLLSCCLVDGGPTIARCIEERITPAAFFSGTNKSIFEVMRELFRAGERLSLEILVEQLRVRRLLEAVGVAYVVNLQGLQATTAHAGFWIERVRSLWLRRELITRSQAAIERAYANEEDVRGMMAQIDGDIRGVTQFAAQISRERMGKRAEQIAANVRARMAGRIDRRKQLRFGLPYIDRVIEPIDVANGSEEWVAVIGGPRSTGKSTCLRWLTLKNCEDGKRGVIYTLETGLQSFLERLAGAKARVNVRALASLPADQRARYDAALAEVTSWIGTRLWVFEDIYTIEGMMSQTRELDRELREKARERAKTQEEAEAAVGLHFAGIDYLQLIELANQPARMQREERLGLICRKLHNGAKDLDLTHIVTAQVGRASVNEKRRPTLADFRESGAIENTADVVLALHTLPENKAGVEQDERMTELLQELLVLKRRNGATGYEQILFQKHLAAYLDVAHRGDPRPGSPKPQGGYKRTGGSS